LALRTNRVHKLGTGKGSSKKSAETNMKLAVLAVVGSGSPWTLQAIGDVCGVSREAIRQVEFAALKKLRKSLSRSGIEEEFLRL
jgi:hypothetical protein